MAEKNNSSKTIEAEIFSVGTWNDETFTLADLQEIAHNFDRLKNQLKPPLKFGHDKNQTLLGQSDGDPALGWVESLKVVGEKLIATFAGVPPVVYQAIEAQRYKQVSAEIYFQVRVGGKKLGKALKAVALLGADLPAVTNLQDLTAFLSEGKFLPSQKVKTFTLSIPLSKEKKRMTHPTNPDLNELAELRSYKAEHEKNRLVERENSKQRVFSQAKGAALAFCDAQVSAGKLAPFLREKLVKALQDQAVHFSEKEGVFIPFSWAQEILEQQSPLLERSELAFSSSESAQGKEGETPSQQVARMANAKMVELGISYSSAAEYVLKNNPPLAEAYRDSTL